MKHCKLKYYLLFFLTLSLTAAQFGCSARIIKGTTVKNTSRNRDIVDFMLRYKNAMQSLSTKKVLALVSKNYHITNTVSHDSFNTKGINTLKKKLQKTFSKIKVLQLDFHIQKITKKKNKVIVSYLFVEKALLELPSEKKWISLKDTNVLILQKTLESSKKEYKIIKGI